MCSSSVVGEQERKIALLKNLIISSYMAACLQLLKTGNFHTVFLQPAHLNNTSCRCWNVLYITQERQFSLLLIMMAKNKAYEEREGTLKKVSSQSYLSSPTIPFESFRTVFLYRIICFLFFKTFYCTVTVNSIMKTLAIFITAAAAKNNNTTT